MTGGYTKPLYEHGLLNNAVNSDVFIVPILLQHDRLVMTRQFVEGNSDCEAPSFTSLMFASDVDALMASLQSDLDSVISVMTEEKSERGVVLAGIAAERVHARPAWKAVEAGCMHHRRHQ